jgi:orotidine-5'-phosphate decarboxylase
MNNNQLTYVEKQARERICLALDINNKEEILKCVKELCDLVGYFKINFTYDMFGADLVKEILSYSTKVFLDLKIHDIPNTAAGYVENVIKLGVHIVTVHTSGGKDMMNEIINSAKRTGIKLNVQIPKFIGVTLLTSIDKKIMNNELNIRGSLKEEVARRAKLAADSGLDGIVCSATELPLIKSGLPDDFFYVTPGIRMDKKISHDHNRTTTYSEAIKAGSNLIVVGREILSASDKRFAIMKVIKEVSNEL